MPRHKVTFNFEPNPESTGTAGARAGWSESWYDPEDLTDAAAEFSATILAARRRGLLTPGWNLSFMRISRLDAQNNLMRRGRLVFIPPQDAPGSYPGANINEQAYDALVVSLSGALGFRRAFSLRGIGRDVVNAGSRFLNPPAFVTAFNAWRDELTGVAGDFPGPGWGIRYRTLILPVSFPTGTIPIQGVDISHTAPYNGTPQSPVIQLGNVADVAALASNQTLVVQNVLGFAGINGTWKIQEVTGGVNSFIRLFAKRRVTVSGQYVASGFCRAYVYALDFIAQATPGYGSSRQTGRPLTLSRGRRSARPF